MSPILGIWASSIQPSLNASSYESIATVTVGSGGSSTIDFTSIPSTYKHLQLRMNIQTNRPTYSADNMYIRFNNDSGGNYSRHQLIGDGSSASSGAAASQTEIFIGSISSSVDTYSFGGSVLDILDYASTSKNKTTRALTGYNTPSYYAMCVMSGAWYNNTTAINRITIYPQSGTAFTQNTQVALYGIKG